MNFNERATNVLEMPVSPITWDGIVKECQRLEREFAYIPSSVKWALDYKRFKVEQARGNGGDALWYLKSAIATAPYNADVLSDYKQVVQKSSDLDDLVLVISSKVNEAMALALARDPARLGALRARLAANCVSGPLFDPLRFARAIEAAYAKMAAGRVGEAAAKPEGTAPDAAS